MNGLSKYYIKKIITSFSEEQTATDTSRKLKVNRNTVNKYYRMIREAVADYQEILLSGQTRNGNAHTYHLYWHKSTGLTTLPSDDAIAFYLTLLNGKVYVEEKNMDKIKNLSGEGDAAAAPKEELVVHELNIDAVEQKPLHARTGMDKSLELAYVFFIYAKEKLTKFYGVKEEYSYLYLKELEFRFNNRDKDLSQIVWKILPHHSPEWVKTNKFRK